MLRKLLESRRFEYLITILIVINAIVLGLETSRRLSMDFKNLLYLIDMILLLIFTCEVLLRIWVYRLSFFRNPWSLFDFAVVSIAWIPAAGNLSVLRALRILRVLRLIAVVPTLRRVVGGLVAALPGMGSILFLLLLVFYVFAVMATKLYGDAFPVWFGSIGASMYTLFQVMTLESWSMGIVRPVMAEFPMAWLFFLPFIICTSFTVLNLFIGIIVSAMQTEHEQESAADREALHDEQETILTELRQLRAEIRELRQG